MSGARSSHKVKTDIVFQHVKLGYGYSFGVSYVVLSHTRFPLVSITWLYRGSWLMKYCTCCVGLQTHLDCELCPNFVLNEEWFISKTWPHVQGD
jgi:hypothetical protein